MSHNPRVSVLMPVHNGMPFLPETVESILQQSLEDFELIVIDDGSTDEGPAYLRSLGDDRVRYHRLERAGLVAALNEGLRQASSDTIARIDADDIAAPTRLEEQYRYLEANPRCVLLGCDYWQIDAAGNRLYDNPFNMTSEIALRFRLGFSATFVHPGVMYRGGAVRDVGWYRPEFNASEDYDLFSRLALRGDIACLPRKLLTKRLHDSAFTVVNWERGIRQSSVIARNYLGEMFPDLDSPLVSELFLLKSGRPHPRSSPGELWQTFQYLCRCFDQRYGPLDAEAVATIRDVGKTIGRECINHARSIPADLRTAFAWIVAARRFAPDHVSLRGAFRRGVRKMSRYLGAANPRRHPELAAR